MEERFPILVPLFFSSWEVYIFGISLREKGLSGRKSFLRKFQNIKFSSPSKMWVLKKLNQNQDFASGKFSSQFQLAEFMGIHPRTLNKALSEDRNSFVFRGELVSVHQLPEFQLKILLEITNSLKRRPKLWSFLTSLAKQFISPSKTQMKKCSRRLG